MQTTVSLTTAGVDGFGLGLKAVGMRKWLDGAQSGAAVAHDTMEHANGYAAIGSVHDELMALGGVTVCRAGRYTIEQMAREAARQVSHTTTLGARFGRAPAVWLPVVNAEREPASGNDSELIAIAENCAKFTMIDRPLIESRADDILHYMRRGRRIARARFGTEAAATRQFDAITAAADSVLYKMRSGEEYELTWGDGVATCTRVDESTAIKPVAAGKAVRTYYAKMYGPENMQRNVYREGRV